MKKSLEKIVKWFCSKLTLNEFYSALVIFLELASKSDLVKFKKDLTDLPNYRKFSVDDLPPLIKKSKEKPENYKLLLKAYKTKTGKELKSVFRHSNKQYPPQSCRCKNCNAPSNYLSYNNGKLQTQLRCKVCKKVSMVHETKRKDSGVKFHCPHCENRLTKWKVKPHVIIYKCQNYKCSNYLKAKNALTGEEKKMYNDGKTCHFSLHYIYREYHFIQNELIPSRPENKNIDLSKSHYSMNTIGLVLSYSINYGMSARMTADVLKNVHNIKMCHQTVINIMEAAASYVTKIMDKNPVKLVGKECSADETYLKVNGETRYTWFVIDTISKAIVGFHLSNQRDTKNALIALIDAFGKEPQKLQIPERPIDFIADGNPSYDAAILEYQKHIDPKERPISRKKVIGLQNNDEQSTEFRALKQLVERLNRTYKFHTRPRAGFKNMEGAVVLTTLFVLYHNYMRPKSRRTNSPPIKHDLFDGLTTSQERRSKILSLAS